MVHLGKSEARQALGDILGDDLKNLCDVFELPTGGSNDTRISRLLELGDNSHSRLVALSRQIVFGYCAEEFITVRELKAILSEAGLSAGGSKHDIYMVAVTSDIAPARRLLEMMNARKVRRIYNCLFERPPVAPESELKEEIKTWLDYTPPRTRPEPALPKTYGSVPEGAYRMTAVRESESEPMQSSPADHYDVAISYAGEDTDIARAIADAMKNLGITVYVALERQSDLWGKDLEIEFKEVFETRATYVIVLVSQHYPHKDFTNFEFTIARDAAQQRKEEFILPVRLDNTPVLGLRSGVCYIDYNKSGALETAKTMKEKLSRKHTQSPVTERRRNLREMPTETRDPSSSNSSTTLSFLNPEKKWLFGTVVLIILTFVSVIVYRYSYRSLESFWLVALSVVLLIVGLAFVMKRFASY